MEHVRTRWEGVDGTEGSVRQVGALSRRVGRLEERLEQLERTLDAITSERLGTALSGPCLRCHRAVLVVRDNWIYCPVCGYHRPL